MPAVIKKPKIVKPAVIKAPKIIKVGTDFSGIDGSVTALNRMFPYGKFRVIFGSDTNHDAHVMSAHMPGARPEKMYVDVNDRTPANEKEDGPLDLYVTTPPCQSFSMAGNRHGVADARGKLLSVSVKFIARCQPRCVVLENVKGFSTKKFASVKNGVTKALNGAGYAVHWQVLTSDNFQVPQKRARTFMVAIRKDCLRGDRKFRWPVAVTPKVNLKDALDPPMVTDKPGRLPPGPKAKVLAKRAYKKALLSGVNPLVTPISVDIDCSEKYQSNGVNIANTLTRTRGGQGGPWISSRGRRTSVSELIKIQGFKCTELPWVKAGLSAPKIVGMLLGNSVPVPMIGSVLSEAMYSAGITIEKVPFPKY